METEDMGSFIFSNDTFYWLCFIRIQTLVDVLNGSTDATVKGAGIGRTLEGQSELFIVDSPMVENGVDFVVYNAFLEDTLQNHLSDKQRKRMQQIKIENLI